MVFPVRVITVGMLVVIVTMAISIYVAWRGRHPMAPRRRAAVERGLSAGAATLLVAGTVLVAVWPMLVAPGAFALSVALCLTLLGFELAGGRSGGHGIHHHGHGPNG